MTCPTCNGLMAALFTSSYCPACDAKAEAAKQYAHVERPAKSSELPCVDAASPGTLFVDSNDGELYWVDQNGTRMRLTNGHLGRVVAFQYDAGAGRLMVTQHEGADGVWKTYTGNLFLPQNVEPKRWEAP